MRVALVSFRLGGPDGVSVETEKWRAALHALGHTTYRVAGAFGSGEPGDVTVPGLGYSAAVAGPDDSAPPAIGVLDAALADADLVVVENVFGLPLHPAATAVLAQVLASRPRSATTTTCRRSGASGPRWHPRPSRSSHRTSHG